MKSSLMSARKAVSLEKRQKAGHIFKYAFPLHTFATAYGHPFLIQVCSVIHKENGNGGWRSGGMMSAS
jgi:hypothetical protein